MIRLDRVTRAYAGEVLALNDVSLEIAAHEFVAITGPSGCGKSTLMHLIGGLDTPTSGEVWVNGLALHRAGDKELTEYRRSSLGIVFQFFNLLPTMTVLENVSLPLLLAGSRLRPAQEAAKAWLERAGLTNRWGHFPHQLSGGEMQRTAIARALVHEPAVLLADEPTGNLDSANAALVMETLQKIASQRICTMVIVTHSEEVARVPDRRIVMRDGSIVPKKLTNMNPETLKMLHGLPLFAEFTEVELEGTIDLIDKVQYAPGECIVKQDEKGDCMFVLVDGSARVVHRRDGKDIELAVLKVGDFFGELALVDSGPRSADVETLTPCTLLRIEHGALRAIAGVYPNAAFKLLIAVGRAMVVRMRKGNQKYIDSLLTGKHE